MIRKILVGLVIPAILLYGAWVYIDSTNDKNLTLDGIINLYQEGKTLAEKVANETGAVEIGDVKILDEGEKIKFLFGDMSFDLEKEKVLTEQVVNGLSRLEITFLVTEEGNYEFYWKGESIGIARGSDNNDKKD